jgi:hypothetical protein
MTDLIACVHAGQSWRRSKPGLRKYLQMHWNGLW